MLDDRQSDEGAKQWLKVADAVTGDVGHEFLKSLVESLRDHMSAALVFITVKERGTPPSARAIYALEDGAPIDGFSYELDGTPCKIVYRGQTMVVPRDVARDWPAEEGFEGYIGVPVFAEEGGSEVVGHLALVSREPIGDCYVCVSIARMFAQRIQTERRRHAMERQRDGLIEDLRSMNERLRRRYLTVHEANAFKTRLVGVIAHDLRNPLAAILAQAELIETLAARQEAARDGGSKIAAAGSKIAAAGSKVVGSAERMAGLIDATLRRVREDMVSLEIDRTDTDLAALAAMALEANARAAAAKGITLDCAAPPRLSIAVDEELLLEAIDNLISNAVKYSYPGGRVRVTLSADAETARIQVADDGQGLTEADLARVFGRFATLSAKPTGSETATGLGLANVKEIVEAHGGQVHAASDGRDHGAVFTIELPVGQG